VDNDTDGVPDALEYALAHKFFPHVLLQWGDIDLEESYLFQGQATPYMVTPLAPIAGSLCDEAFACLEIRYPVLYHYDHGDGLDFGFGAHLGDSEFYAALVQRTTPYGTAQTDPASWQLIRDFTAAHQGTVSDSSNIGVYGAAPTACSSYHTNPSACTALNHCGFSPGLCTGLGGACGGFATPDSCTSISGCLWHGGCTPRERSSVYASAPIDGPVTVFAAESKHAMYHTDDECDSGSFLYSDDCPNNQFDLRAFKEDLLQNVGNVTAHSAFDTTVVSPKPTPCVFSGFCTGLGGACGGFSTPDSCTSISGCLWQGGCSEPPSSQCSGSYDVWSTAEFGDASSIRSKMTLPLAWPIQ
jgi:hypothetical protein